MDDITRGPEDGLLFEVTDRVVVASVHASVTAKGRKSPVVVAFDSIGSYLDSRPDEDHFLEFTYQDRDYVCSVTQKGSED